MSIPFNRQGHGILWFMYTLVGLYLVAPVISTWLQKCGKRNLQLYISLWVISLCYPFLEAFVEINDTPYGILYYFSGFLGYFVLGYYLNTYGLKGRTWKYVILLVCLMPVMLIYKFFIEGKYELGEELFGYLGPICVLMLISWWKICVATANRIKNEKVIASITMVSNLSFGVYLIHIYVMRTFVYKLCDYIENYFIQTVCAILLTISITLLISYCISKLSFGDYLIGYKKKKS